MTGTSNPKLTRFTKFVVDLLYYLLAGAALVLALWILISPLVSLGTDILITASVPVAIGEGSEPKFDVEVVGSAAKGIQNAFLDESQGTLRLETTNWRFTVASNLAKLLTAIGLAYVFYLLRSILQGIMRGEPFGQDNVLRLRKMGWAVLAVGFLRPTVEYLAAKYILDQLVLTKPPLSLPSPFKSEVILASLLIFILVQVWSYGLELERERALTI